MAVYTFIQKNAWWLISIFFVLLILNHIDTPVFWDMYGQVKTARYFIDTNFTNLIPNTNGFTDNGYFPLYAIYLAALFKLFGYKLWIAHLSVMPFVIGLLYQLQHFCRHFLTPEKTLFVLLLVCIHPAVEAQSIYFSSEICFVFLSVWLLNTIIDERASRMALSSLLVCLLNFRGLPFVIFLALYFIFFKKQKSAWYVVSGVLVSILWLLVHFYMSGWLFKNPENIEHRTFLPVSGMVKNIFWFMVKLTDFANIIGLIFIALFSFREKKINELSILWIIASISVLAFCVPLSNPIGTRYFLLAYILMLPAFILSVSSFSFQKFIAACILFTVFLWQSGRLIKPDKYGNAWDCTLAGLDYFEARKQLDAYVQQNHIAPKDVAAGFQVYFNDNYYLMNGSGKEYDLLSDTEMNANFYIADSNICNNYNPLRKEHLKNNYTLVRSFIKGPVYINLYKKNPSFKQEL